MQRCELQVNDRVIDSVTSAHGRIFDLAGGYRVRVQWDGTGRIGRISRVDASRLRLENSG